MVGALLLAIVVGVTWVFHVVGTLWKYWYITVPVALLIWFWLLAWEFGPRPSAEVRHELHVLRRWIPFTIKKRLRPAWTRLKRAV